MHETSTTQASGAADDAANAEMAQAAINLVTSGVSFSDVAVEMSADSSAARGG